MKQIAIFGPTKDDPWDVLDALRKHLDKIERPFTIVTSTTQGWDAAARMYADRYVDVYLMVRKARIRELGHEEGCKDCNRKMEAIVDEGITKKGVDTKISSHMVKLLEKSGKKITYLEID
jgi:hypothetical protein